MARSTYADDYPWATPAQALVESGLELIQPHWGDGSLIEVAAPSQANNPRSREWFARMQRATASPGMMAALVQMFFDLDVRDVVPSVQVPALVLHRVHDRLVNVRNGRWLAEHLPDARLVELPGDDHVPWYEEPEQWLGAVQEFLTGVRAQPRADRVLATVLFTDIVDSTGREASVGDTSWRRLLDGHDRLALDLITRRGGRIVKQTGDGLLAAFSDPARRRLPPGRA